MATTKKEKKVKVAPAEKPSSQNGVSGIADRAMLVSLTVRRWQPHTTDKKISAEVANNHKASKDMGKYRKRLLAKAATQATSDIGHQLRSLHYDLTLPWSDDGPRILSGMGYMAYQQKVNALKQQFDTAWQAFLPEYPRHKAEAKALLGTAYNEEDYPPVSVLKTKFAVEIHVQPIPTGKDFRVDVGNEELARIRKQIDEDAKATIEASMKTVWGRLKAVVEHQAKRLKLYKQTDEGVEHSFRDSLVTNIVELLDLLPSLNVTEDKDLERFAIQVRKELTAYPATVLRDDEKVRTDVARRADEILAKMEGFLS